MPAKGAKGKPVAASPAKGGAGKAGSSKEDGFPDAAEAIHILIDTKCKDLTAAFEGRLADQNKEFNRELKAQKESNKRKRDYSDVSSDEEEVIADGAVDASGFGAGVPEVDWGDGARRA
jgi:hypothetical protein